MNRNKKRKKNNRGVASPSQYYVNGCMDLSRCLIEKALAEIF